MNIPSLKPDASLHAKTLQNGVQLLCQPMPHLQTFSLGVWVKTGARMESVENHGISHFLEHMAFKGTKRRSALQIARDIENVGGAINAATGYESTQYWAHLPEGALPLAADLLTDILLNPVFDPDEIVRERDVIMQEIAQSRDTPDDVLFDLLLDASFPEHPLGRNILGRAETVQKFKAQDFFQHLKSHYGANQILVAATGKVEAEAFFDELQEKTAAFSQIPAPVLTPARTSSAFRPFQKDLEQAHCAVSFEGVSQTSPFSAQKAVFCHIFGGGMSSRLFQEIREKRGLCYSISSFSFSLSDTGLWGFTAASAPDKAEETLRASVQIIAEATESITEEELRRAKAQMTTGLMMILESAPARNEQMAQAHIAYGFVPSLPSQIAQIEAIEKDDLSAFAQTLLKKRPPALSIVSPFIPEGIYDELRNLLP